MKFINYLRRNKYFALVFVCLSFLIAGVITLCCGGTNVYVHAAEFEDDLVSNQAYLSAHYTDGTMGALIDESYGLDNSLVTLANSIMVI